MNKLPGKPDAVAIATAAEALVLSLIVEEASRLEALKEEARVAALAKGMTEIEVDALFPPYPAGAFGIDVKKG